MLIKRGSVLNKLYVKMLITQIVIADVEYEHIKAIDVDSAEIVSFAQIRFHDLLTTICSTRWQR
jgi:hypothetical protein